MRQLLTPDMSRTMTVRLNRLQITQDLKDCKAEHDYHLNSMPSPGESESEFEALRDAKLQLCKDTVHAVEEELQAFDKDPYGPTLEIGFVPASLLSEAKARATFDIDASNISSEDMARLKDIARLLCKHGVRNINVEGLSCGPWETVEYRGVSVKQAPQEVIDLLERNNILDECAALVREYNTLSEEKKKG